VPLLTSTEVGRLSRRRGATVRVINCTFAHGVESEQNMINKSHNERGYVVRRCVFVIGF
jgi:hypothetical protein